MFGACYPSSVFDWSPAVRAFGHAPWTSNVPIIRTSQQPQPQPQPSGLTGFVGFFGGNPFGMNQTNYASSQPAVSAIGSPSFCHTINPGFLCTSSSSFGSTTTPPAPAHPSTTTAVPGSTTSAPAFGIPSTTGAFGSPTTPSFGIPASHSSTMAASGSTTAFGTPITTGFFGSTITPTFSDPRSSRAFASHTIGADPGFLCTSSSSFGSTTTPPALAHPSTTTAVPGSTTSAPAFGIPTTTGAFGSPTTPAFGIPASHSSTMAASGSTTAFGTPITTGFFGSTTAFGTPITTGFFGSTITPTFSDPRSTRAFASHTIGACSSTLPPPLCANCSMPNATSSGSGESFGDSATSVRQLSSTNASLTSTTPASRMPAASISPTSSTTFFNFPPTLALGGSLFGNPIPPLPPFSENQVAIRPSLRTGSIGQCKGTRVAPYTQTSEMVASLSSTGMPGRVHSISAIPFYKSKSHEELRWEDYDRGDKGGLLPSYNVSAQHKDGIGRACSSNISNPFTTNTSAFGTSATPGFSNPFTTNTPFFSTRSTPSILGASTASPTFPGRSIFEASVPSSPTFQTDSSSSIQWPCTHSLGGQTGNPAIGETSSGLSSNPSYNQTNMSNMNPVYAGFPPSTPSSIPPTKPLPFGHTMPSQSSFQASQPSQATNSGSFNNLHPMQSDGGSVYPGASSTCGQNNLGQSYPCVYPLELRVVLPWGLFLCPLPPYLTQVVPYQPQHPGAAYFASPHIYLEPRPYCQATPPPFGAPIGIPCANWNAPSSSVAQASSAFQLSTTSPSGTGTHPFAPSSRVAQAGSAFHQSTTSPFESGTHPFAPSSRVAQAGSAFQQSTTSPFESGTHPFAPYSGVAQAGSDFQHSTTSPFGTTWHHFSPSSGFVQAGTTLTAQCSTAHRGPNTSSRVAQTGSAFEQSTSPFGTATHPFAPSAGSAFQRSTTSPFGTVGATTSSLLGYESQIIGC